MDRIKRDDAIQAIKSLQMEQGTPQPVWSSDAIDAIKALPALETVPAGKIRPQIQIIVEGGMVQEVLGSDPNVDVTVIDLDTPEGMELDSVTPRLPHSIW